jgi:hypothetical protein
MVLPGQEDRGQHVGVDRADPGLALDATETARRSAAGIVDANVGLRGCRQLDAAPLFGCDVGYDRGDTDAHLALDVVSQRCKCCFAARIDHEIDAFARQRNRDGPVPARAMPHRRSLSCLEFRDPS